MWYDIVLRPNRAPVAGARNSPPTQDKEPELRFYVCGLDPDATWFSVSDCREPRPNPPHHITPSSRLVLKVSSKALAFTHTRAAEPTTRGIRNVAGKNTQRRRRQRRRVRNERHCAGKKGFNVGRDGGGRHGVWVDPGPDGGEWVGGRVQSGCAGAVHRHTVLRHGSGAVS